MLTLSRKDKEVKENNESRPHVAGRVPRPPTSAAEGADPEVEAPFVLARSCPVVPRVPLGASWALWFWTPRLFVPW